MNVFGVLAFVVVVIGLRRFFKVAETWPIWVRVSLRICGLAFMLLVLFALGQFSRVTAGVMFVAFVGLIAFDEWRMAKAHRRAN